MAWLIGIIDLYCKGLSGISGPPPVFDPLYEDDGVTIIFADDGITEITE